ncbi:MAG: hypothetical protein ACJ74Z_12810 [Bryobacteraceae bacterium]
MIGWGADFSYSYLRKLLEVIRSDFEPQLLGDAGQLGRVADNRWAFVRHDVDVDLSKAVRMAEIESEHGVRAAYMIMNASLMYSLRDLSVQKALRQIQSLGHEVGLHFDCPGELRHEEKGDLSQLESDIESACRELEECVGSPVRSLSFHRPIPWLLRGPLLIGSRVNAYAAELMAWYLSDSKGCWREGEPIPKLRQPPGHILQLLTHPIWWGDRHLPPAERLDEFVRERTAGLSGSQAAEFDQALASTLPGVQRQPYRVDHGNALNA